MTGAKPAYAHGLALEDEAIGGALTLGGYLNEIGAAFASRQAAVLHLDGETISWTYDDLVQRSREVARALIASGIGKGMRVGILVTNRPEFLACAFGTALAGGVAATISTFFTAAELDQVLAASACSVLLIERHVLKKDFAAMLAELEPEVRSAAPGELASTRFPFLRHVAAIDGERSDGAVEAWPEFLARGNGVSDELLDAASASVSPSDPGVLFFSSGSTGKAKGILSAHRGVTLQLWRWKHWYGADAPRTWSVNGFFFSGNFAMALGSTLSSGGCLVLQRWFDAEEGIALIEREAVSLLLAWPHQWAQIMAAPNYEGADLSSLRYIDRRCPIAAHPSVSTDWIEPRQAYGSTETFTLVTAYPANTPEAVHQGSHGLPTPGSTVKIVDRLTGEALSVGERGEIAVKGPTLMLGYIGVPLDETLDGEGFFHTGDGGYLDGEGRLFWEGRLNDIVKTGGANVSPLEIDAVIRNCPGVKIVQTVGVPDDLLGEMVVACVVPKHGAAPSEEELRDFARRELASFKVPRRVLFFAEEEMKTTGSAKIKTADLRTLAAKRLAGD